MLSETVPVINQLLLINKDVRALSVSSAGNMIRKYENGKMNASLARPHLAMHR